MKSLVEYSSSRTRYKRGGAFKEVILLEGGILRDRLI